MEKKSPSPAAIPAPVRAAFAPPQTQTTAPAPKPDFYRSIAEEETPARAAADFISGMSDRYCVDLYEGMVIPRSWPVL